MPPAQTLNKPWASTKRSHLPLSMPHLLLRLKYLLTSSPTRPNLNRIPDIGLSPRPALPLNPEPDFDITWDIDDPEPSKLPVKKPGSTSARSASTASAKHTVSSDKRPTSPDPYDNLSFDIDVDESFFEQVGMIEQGALGAGANITGKGKGKDTGTEGTASHKRSSAAPARNSLSGSVLGTKHLAKCPVSPPGAEPSTRMQDSTKRATSATSLSGSADSPMPQCTQSSDHRLPRDPSLIVISSEDEAPGDHGAARPLDLARRRANKRRKMDQDEGVDSDVINISD